MVKFTKDGAVDYTETNLQDLRDYCAGFVLERFVSGGGRGLKLALWEVMHHTIAWDKVYQEQLRQEQKQKKKRE